MVNIRNIYKVLPKEDIRLRLLDINSKCSYKWKLIEGDRQCKLQVSYKFKDYPSTWQFLATVAREAHKAKHHPSIFTVYNKVDLELTTHDKQNQVTGKDISLAETIHDAFINNLTRASDGFNQTI